MKPVFTVVIPAYNRANFIKKAIRSVLQQSYKGWKLLIIDDGSSDNTKQVVKPFLKNPRIRYLRLNVNSGISKVMNRAIKLVDTPYMVQLDSDDWLPPVALAVLKKTIDRDRRKKTALFYGNVQIWRVNKKLQYHKAKFVRHRQFENKYQFLVYTSWMVGPRCYLVSALRKVGGWDVSDQFGGRIMEDRRIILRLIERYPVKWINQTLYNRTKHQNQLTDGESKRKRNMLRRQTFEHYLKRWGNRYKAVYGYRTGYLKIRKLVKVRRPIRK